MKKGGSVYILASKQNGTLYVGVTSELEKRIYQHKNNLIEGFTQKYNVHSLVWFEEHPDIESAILREKQLKKWNRAWKLDLIEASNPQWKDLSKELFGWIPDQAGDDDSDVIPAKAGIQTKKTGNDGGCSSDGEVAYG